MEPSYGLSWLCCLPDVCSSIGDVDQLNKTYFNTVSLMWFTFNFNSKYVPGHINLHAWMTALDHDFCCTMILGSVNLIPSYISMLKLHKYHLESLEIIPRRQHSMEVSQEVPMCKVYMHPSQDYISSWKAFSKNTLFYRTENRHTGKLTCLRFLNKSDAELGLK